MSRGRLGSARGDTEGEPETPSNNVLNNKAGHVTWGGRDLKMTRIRHKTTYKRNVTNKNT